MSDIPRAPPSLTELEALSACARKRDLDTPDAPTGLVILRASRLEALIPPLQQLLDETRPTHPLAPQTVIAAHPGMKQWLAGALARHAGAAGIVANLEIDLPSTWLDRLSNTLLGAQAVALPRYRRGPMRWSLHGLLANAAAHGITDPRFRAYLAAEGSTDLRAQRHFQLADRLAKLFSQYLVYRSDWLAAWEAGLTTWVTGKRADRALRALESQALAPLWRALVADLGGHRGRLVETLVKTLGSTTTPLPPLHVFGLSHLPPAELAVLRAYARHALVSICVPDPCREYWGGLHSSTPRGDGRGRDPDAEAWRSFREDEAARLADPAALDWREQGHPLLARWGRLGQHFFAALTEDAVREDIRHWKDEADDTPGTRLQRLQESIRRLQPALMREDAAATKEDASLRVHACHTRLRELEVLRDALLDAIDKDGIRPGGMVVMAPDIRAYLPLIPAVFGEAGSTHERLLPYHLADVPVARSHPLLTVFESLLGLGHARISAPEVADLLGVAEVRRALSLGDAAADGLLDWLRGSRVAWALDGKHKARLGLPPRSEHSFAWAMDRMLAGYLMADPSTDPVESVQLADGTDLLPLAGIQGPDAAALGSLDRLLCELQAWCDLAGLEQPASVWAETLRMRVDALLHIDPADADARAALSVLHRAIAQLAAEPASNGLDPLLRLVVVRELLQDALAAVPERQHFLMGGIPFCGMVPQRAVPFDVVAVLGLDEDQFPRRAAHGGIDLMATLRRLGDRDVPGDDRYLFLETVMAARQRLHLSFIGQGVRDGKHRNPAAPLAELLAELDRHAGLEPDDEKSERPWLLRHPLQPFDAGYFDGRHPGLFSYSAAFAGMSGDGRNALPRLREGGLLAPGTMPGAVPLRRLEAFFRDPAKALLHDHLQISLDALDDDARLADEEPLDAIPRIATVARQVFLRDVLPHRCADPAWIWDAEPPAWLRHGGLLPVGTGAVAAWAGEAAAIEALWACAERLQRFDARGVAGARTLSIDIELTDDEDGAPLRLTGLVPAVFALRGSAEGLQRVFAHPEAKKGGLKSAAAIGFRESVPAFLQWAALRLQRTGNPEPAPVRLTVLAEQEPAFAMQANAWDERYCASEAEGRRAMEADLRRRLRGLVALWQQGCQGGSWWYPRTASKVLQKRPAGDGDLEAWIKAAAKDATDTWRGGFQSGERDDVPGYARWLEGDLVFGDAGSDPGHKAFRAMLDETRRIDALIHLGDAPPSSHAREQAA